jgi:nicotinate-nucleotide--dimethylbenzimidazole phosphoribosyltransferase
VNVQQLWPRPVPTIGDQTSSSDRAADPRGWAFSDEDRAVLGRIMGSRRDIRRFRPDPVPEETVRRIVAAAHLAPSVGHSQPWRFVVVRDPIARARAAVFADRARMAQAACMDPDAARHLLDLDLEGIREAPLGLVVCCDRRAQPGGVLGRATFHDADMWSCACAIENLWLAARAEGLGVGWVTLFKPDELADLVRAPEGVATLGWLCLGWPDERPPQPGLERRGWSERLPVDDLVMWERWPGAAGGRDPAPPASRLAMPNQDAVVAAHDSGDRILTPAGSLGVLDRAVDKVLALGPAAGPALGEAGSLVLVGSDHPVARLGVSAYPGSVTRDVTSAAVAGVSVGALAALDSGLDLVVVDAGIDGPPVDGVRPIRPAGERGDLVSADGLAPGDAENLVAAGASLARDVLTARRGPIAIGEVGVGNSTVAAALACAVLDVEPGRLVGLGAGSDSAIVARKCEVVEAALARVRGRRSGAGRRALRLLGALGGGEFAVLTGVILGAAEERGLVILDGMATSVAALLAVEIEPAVTAHLIAGQRSREAGHRLILEALGLEPLLDLRIRAGEGAGAAMASLLLRTGLRIRSESARTATAL